ncbi:hypothetical protein DL766_004663 [Monosporascus sp. MC13-8B]|uniref:Uncharacterized protein n=1 Tax=Monosporascus cannonballus TaxID=155416 RepID=A0ABY0HE43_9PEZI|nr:hypothetical protein DL763_007977 [Monosporascus cannonballus]RYO91434.1 hypothetical protein DL762_002160 [Monosporascus cannonballus]RYP30944.1 hypothetical protein DL766_004663 [Monosporascus sp. MC13-8B]
MANPEPPQSAISRITAWGITPNRSCLPSYPQQPGHGNSNANAQLRLLPATADSSLAPTGLATLITAQHLRPFQAAPMALAPLLLFSSYANLQGFRKDSAGITAAASGTYAVLALRGRRRDRLLSVRGTVRAAAVALGLANAVAGGWVYATADRESERRERTENPRWG